MAKFKKGILGGISGKLGPVVGSSWKGIPYLKTVNTTPVNKEPSPAQLAHHQKFRFLTRWLRPLHPYLTAGYRNLAQHNTEINIAFSSIFSEAVKGVAPDFYIEYQKVRVSQGELGGIEEVVVSLTAQDTLHLSWSSGSSKHNAYNDQLMLVLYSDTIGFADGFIGGIKRSAGSCTFTFDGKLVGKPFHVMVGLIALDGRKVSNSQYLGLIGA